MLSLAIERIYRPVWSAAILVELEDHERTAFSDAEVTGWEPLEGSYGLPDPDDEHVVAAAQIAGARVIVTANLKDFPSKLPPNGIEVIRLSSRRALSVRATP